MTAAFVPFTLSAWTDTDNDGVQRHGYVGTVDPTSLTFALITGQEVWINPDPTTGGVFVYDPNTDTWTPIASGAGGGGDAANVLYDWAPLTTVKAALDQLRARDVNTVDNTLDLQRFYSTDRTGAGLDLDVGDVVEGDGWRYRWVADTTPGTNLAPEYQNLSGAWITSGTVAAARIDVAIARVTDVNTIVQNVLGGLDPATITELKSLADQLNSNPDLLTTLQAGLTSKVDIDAAASGEFYRNTPLGVQGNTLDQMAADVAFSDVYAPLQTPHRGVTAAYTPVVGDTGRRVYLGTASFPAVSVPADVFQDGDTVVFEQRSSNGWTFAAGTNMVVHAAGNRTTTAEQYAVVELYFSGPRECTLSGNLS